MARRANRKDKNHKEITDVIATLRDDYGIAINFTDTHMIKGFCDFVVEFGGQRQPEATPKSSDWIMGCNGLSILVEVKQEGKKITVAEDAYLNRCSGAYIKVENVDDLWEGIMFFIVKAEDWELMIKVLKIWGDIKHEMMKEKEPTD